MEKAQLVSHSPCCWAMDTFYFLWDAALRVQVKFKSHGAFTSSWSPTPPRLYMVSLKCYRSFFLYCTGFIGWNWHFIEIFWFLTVFLNVATALKEKSAYVCITSRCIRVCIDLEMPAKQAKQTRKNYQFPITCRWLCNGDVMNDILRHLTRHWTGVKGLSSPPSSLQMTWS